MRKTLRVDQKDNIIIALTDLNQNDIIQYGDKKIRVRETIPAKHKLYSADFEIGSKIFMHGVLVGRTVCEVKSGSLVTVQNLSHESEAYEYRSRTVQWTPPDISSFKGRTFMGYKRSDGKAGTANYWLFIPTVFCQNRNLDVIKEVLENELGYSVVQKYKVFTRHLISSYKKGETNSPIDLQVTPKTAQNRLFKNIDGVKFLNHSGGCGGTRQDAATLSRLLAAYANHPNVGGITVLSLGCQHLQLDQLLNDIKAQNPNFSKPLLAFEQQDLKNEELTITKAIQETFTSLVELNKTEREPVPVSELCLGVKCGGSDGFSGISANPATGHAADILVALGAKVLLAEFPELCGVEQNLIDRCIDEPTANKFIHLMQGYESRANLVGSGFYMNPSPGNIKDGLITDAMKSAGAAKKGGTSPITDVLDYTEPAIKPGLNLVCTPGNDVEATTGKTAAGATLIIFTTGLGTPTGNPICPVIKIATNTHLAKKMSDIIDFDCGQIISGEKTITEVGEDIVEFCIKVASGEVTPKAVELNQDDFIPWKRDISL